jgi:hypothetical protein
MLLNSGETKIVKSRQIFFENQWTQTYVFREMIQEKWGVFKLKCPDNAYSMDVWHGGGCQLKEVSKRLGG